MLVSPIGFRPYNNIKKQTNVSFGQGSKPCTSLRQGLLEKSFELQKQLLSTIFEVQNTQVLDEVMEKTFLGIAAKAREHLPEASVKGVADELSDSLCKCWELDFQTSCKITSLLLDKILKPLRGAGVNIDFKELVTLTGFPPHGNTFLEYKFRESGLVMFTPKHYAQYVEDFRNVLEGIA